MVYLKKQCPENCLKRRQNEKHTQLPSMQRVKVEKKSTIKDKHNGNYKVICFRKIPPYAERGEEKTIQEKEVC